MTKDSMSLRLKEWVQILPMTFFYLKVVSVSFVLLRLPNLEYLSSTQSRLITQLLTA